MADAGNKWYVLKAVSGKEAIILKYATVSRHHSYEMIIDKQEKKEGWQRRKPIQEASLSMHKPRPGPSVIP